MLIIFEQIAILGIIGLIGFISYKLKAISSEHNNGLVKIIIKITLPLLIFTSFAGADLNKDIVSNFPFVIFASFISVSCLYFLGRASAKVLTLDAENSALHKVHTMFGNVVFLGFPLLNAVFPGGEGLIYAAIFQLGHDSLMWTWGILIMNKATKEKKNKGILHLINPTTVSFFLGTAFLFLKINIPEIIFKPLNSVGHTTIYLSMVYVGAVLAQVKAKSLLYNFRSYLLSFNKLILGPALLILFFYLLQILGLNISNTVVMVSVLQAGMPCMIIISVLAKDMGLNSQQAVENIFVSTVLSLITLPVVYYCISILF